jgi:hypothetical protein
MKALKLVFVAVLMAGVCMASADGHKKVSHHVVYVSFEKAIQHPGLLAAMQLQLNPGFMIDDQEFYTVSVNYQRITYKITGSREQWTYFFTPKWTLKKDYTSKIRYHR